MLPKSHSVFVAAAYEPCSTFARLIHLDDLSQLPSVLARLQVEFMWAEGTTFQAMSLIVDNVEHLEQEVFDGFDLAVLALHTRVQSPRSLRQSRLGALAPVLLKHANIADCSPPSRTERGQVVPNFEGQPESNVEIADLLDAFAATLKPAAGKLLNGDAVRCYALAHIIRYNARNAL